MKRVIFIALLFLNYCSPYHGNGYFEMSVLKKIAQLSLIEPVPPAVISSPVFIIGINDSIYETNFIKLSEVYKALYINKYKSYSDFLFAALNQKIKIDAKNPKTHYYYSQTFAIDSNISHLYKQKGLEGLIGTYCISNDSFYTLGREPLMSNEINSISYYFFLNQYVRTDDDFEATINFKKLALLLN